MEKKEEIRYTGCGKNKETSIIIVIETLITRINFVLFPFFGTMKKNYNSSVDDQVRNQ